MGKPLPPSNKEGMLVTDPEGMKAVQANNREIIPVVSQGIISHGIDPLWLDYRKVSNIRRTLVSNTIGDHSDIVGATPVGAAPTTSSFSI